MIAKSGGFCYNILSIIVTKSERGGNDPLQKTRGGRFVLKSAEGTYNYLKALWHIQKSLVCALIYTTSTPLEIGFDIANSWEYYSAFAGYSHLHIIKAACGLTGAPLSDFTINLISQVSTNITGIHGLVRRVGSDSFPPYFFSAKKWELTCKR